MKPSAIAVALLLPIGAPPLAAATDESLLNNSPFGAPGPDGSSPVVDSQLDQLEFTGVSVIGREIFVSVIDRKTGRGGWLPLKTQGTDGLIAENYDAKKDEITVRLGSRTKVLSLGRAKVTASATLPAPAGPAAAPTPQATAPSASPPPHTSPSSGKPPEIEAQEREARLLVSDLLEIGMIQRKAYAEKKAAEEASRKK
ncbi:MAG: hypothetical protein PHQ04_11205 [Opitutaceae bacterium]|nr:hypothetical protein [Opitutaceae bacterium]